MKWNALCFVLALFGSQGVHALAIQVHDPAGKPLATVMVSRKPVQAANVDRSDNGYAQSGTMQQAFFELTRFTDGAGRVDIPVADHPWLVRLRKPGFKDQLIPAADIGNKPVVMLPETDAAALAEQRPANSWASTIDFGDADLKKEFLLHCNFCHQQGAALLRQDRSEAEWRKAMKPPSPLTAFSMANPSRCGQPR